VQLSGGLHKAAGPKQLPRGRKGKQRDGVADMAGRKPGVVRNPSHFWEPTSVFRQQKRSQGAKKKIDTQEKSGRERAERISLAIRNGSSRNHRADTVPKGKTMHEGRTLKAGHVEQIKPKKKDSRRRGGGRGRPGNLDSRPSDKTGSRENTRGATGKAHNISSPEVKNKRRNGGGRERGKAGKGRRVGVGTRSSP